MVELVNERGCQVVVGPVAKLVIYPQPVAAADQATADLELVAQHLLVVVAGIGTAQLGFVEAHLLAHRSGCRHGVHAVVADVHVAEVVDLHRHFGPNHILKDITATIPE